jgi:hypothetical protein
MMARSRSSHAFDSRPEPAAHHCAWPGCGAEGVHRAPVSRNQLREYQYFCLDHIRDFNRSWNFFEGWKQDEIEAYQHADLSWHRPTWKPGDREVKSQAWRDAFFAERFDDRFGFTRDDEAAGARRKTTGRGEEAAAAEESRRAYATLGLEPGADRAEVKRRFKAEVKLCHPDVNGGDKDAEDRLRDVIWAYRHLTARAAA